MTVKSLKAPQLTIWTWKSNDLNNDPEFRTDAVYSHVNGITYEKRCTLLILHIADFKTNAFSIPVYSGIIRSEEHTSELQSRFDLVCRLLLKKNNNNYR